MDISKNPYFLSNLHETWWKWLSHEAIIFTNFHKDWTKIVDFLVIGNFLVCPVFLFRLYNIKRVGNDQRILIWTTLWCFLTADYNDNSRYNDFLVLLRWLGHFFCCRNSSTPKLNVTYIEIYNWKKKDFGDTLLQRIQDK